MLIYDCCKDVSPKSSLQAATGGAKMKLIFYMCLIFEHTEQRENHSQIQTPTCQTLVRGHQAQASFSFPSHNSVPGSRARLASWRGKEDVAQLGLSCLYSRKGETCSLHRVHGELWRWPGKGCSWQALLPPMAPVLCPSKNLAFLWLLHGQSGLPWGQPWLSAVPWNGQLCQLPSLKRAASHFSYCQSWSFLG